MERWVPNSNAEWNYVHPLVPLGDALTPRAEHVGVHETLGEWAAITIHFDGSIVRRDRQARFKGIMMAAYPGDLVFSKIDARNGAIGLVPDWLPKVVVTSEYPVHIADATLINGSYMAMLLRTPNFLKLIKDAATGTSGRKRITPGNFRAIEIPLPNPEVQRHLVAAYQEALTNATKLENEALQVERDAQGAFEAALGLKPPPSFPKRPFQIARFKNIERWSHE